jgi:hypothetical protein
LVSPWGVGVEALHATEISNVTFPHFKLARDLTIPKDEVDVDSEGVQEGARKKNLIGTIAG